MERLAFSGSLRPRVEELSRHRQSPDREPTSDEAPQVEAARAESGETDRPEPDSLAFRGLLAFTLVLFFRPQDSLPFLEPLHLADVTATFALVALIGGRLSRRAAVSRLTPELVLVLALGLVMLATAPFSVWPGGAVSVVTDLYLKVVLVFGLIVNTVTTRERFTQLTTVVVLGTSYVAVRAVTDYARGVNLVEDGRVSGAVGGLFGNPNDMALNMVSFLPLAVAVGLIRGRPLLRLIALGAVPWIAAAIVFSKSRGGVIGLVAMLVMLLYQLRRTNPGAAVLALVACLAVTPLLPASFTTRMSSIVNPEEDQTGSREARKRLMREAYKAYLENPVAGVGAGQFANYLPHQRDEPWRETHNAVLQVAAELGTLGLIVFVLLIGTGFVAVFRAAGALRRARRRASAAGPGSLRELEMFAAALVASLTGWFAAAMFASVAYYWTFYLVLGLATAFGDISARELDGVFEPDRGRVRPEAA